ncbi:carboxypeptidase-like regulatory domain-containing protein [Salegentibacter sp. HM20]
MQKLILGILFLLLSQVLFSQNFASRLLDAKTGEPLSYATVQYAPNRGVVTSEEGYFNFSAELKAGDTLKISSLGYESLDFILKENLPESILLNQKEVELSDVFLSNKLLNASEIIEKVRAGIASNYRNDYSRQRYFFRESRITSMRQFQLKVKESSIPELDQNLMNRIVNSVPNMTDSYKEVLGDLYGSYETQKIQPLRGASLYNPQALEDISELSEKLQGILQQNLKSDSFLKIKSGLVGVKVDAEEFTNDLAEETREKTPEELAKEQLEKQKRLLGSSNSRIQDLFKNMFWKKDIGLDLFEKTRKYELNLEGVSSFGDAIVYVIDFKPKRGADFRGKIYVDIEDFGVHRLDYENVKALKSFKLFGISKRNDVFRGKMIFAKTQTGYLPKFLELEKGESYGVDRPLKIIEKNKNVKGRRKQNELDLDVIVNSGQRRKFQLVIFEQQPLDKAGFSNFKPSGDFDFKTFIRYNPGFWEGYNIIEPNAAIKSFSAAEGDLLLN